MCRNDKSFAGQPRRSARSRAPARPELSGVLVCRGANRRDPLVSAACIDVYTLELTQSPLLVSMVPLLSMAPMALFGPVIGAIADRVDRKLLYIGSLAAIGVASGGMAAFAWLGDLAFSHVAIAAFMNGIFWATDMPIRRRLLGDLSGKALPAAMSLDAATGNATRMLGPALGGAVLLTMGVFGVFALGVVVYGVCLCLVLFVKFPDSGPSSVPTSLIGDLAAGARYAAGDAHLRRILSITIVFNIFGFPFTSMVPVLGRVQLSLDVFWVGVISSIEGLGAFLGALFVAVVARPWNFMPIYWWGTLIYISSVALLAVFGHFAEPSGDDFFRVSVTLVIIGMAGACFAAMQSTLTYLGTPALYRSRVLGILTLCIGAGPIGFLNVGWMADLWDAPTALFIMAVEGLIALYLLHQILPAAEPEKHYER